MKISIVVAVATNRVIGDGGRLPWNLPADLKLFRERTSGHPIIMGRKTFESIGRALPKRHNIVISRQEGYKATGCSVVGSLEEALEVAQGTTADEVFIIGGSEIYRLALPIADNIYMTKVHTEARGEVLFPEFDEGRFYVVSCVDYPAIDGSPPFSVAHLAAKNSEFAQARERSDTK